MSEWISCKERLPEIGQRVIATNGTFTGEAYLRGHRKAFYRPYESEWEAVFDEPVTHWMPLPIPPAKGVEA